MENSVRKVVVESLRVASRLLTGLLILQALPAASAAVIGVDQVGCNLADAVRAAENDASVGGCASGAGADLLVLVTDVVILTPDGFHLDGYTALPLVTTDITIAGGGFTISRPQSESFRIFAIAPGGSLTLRNVTVEAITDAPDWDVGFLGGVIRNDGSLATFDTELYAEGIEPAISEGGAVYNTGVASFVDSLVYHGGFALRGGGLLNAGTASFHGGEVYGFAGEGGAVNNLRQLSFDGTLIHGLALSWAGAVFNQPSGELVVERSRVTGGSWGQAGCIVNDGSMTVAHSAVTGCTANGDVGAIFNPGQATLDNTTLSGNKAGEDPGVLGFTGAIHSPGPLTMTLCTVVTNRVTAAPGQPIAGIRAGSDSTIRDSIVAANVVQLESGFSFVANCAGTFADDGGNFTDDGTCGPGFAPIVPGTHFDTVLKDNGGSTMTHALLPGSPAVDAAAACPASTDQRGYLRDDGSCDSGAYELDGTGCEGGSAPTTFYQDLDGDGYGSIPGEEIACEPPVGFVANGEDCDDTDPLVNPAAFEVCGDGIDNDCDPASPLPPEQAWYLDLDGDGYGGLESVQYTCGEPLEGYISIGGDCDDTDPVVNPEGTEVCADGIDNDCNVNTADAWDDDFDGTTCDADCNDANPAIWLAPGEVRNLRFWINPQVILWDPPLEPGALTLGYQLLRSPSAGDFVSVTWCTSTNFDSTADPEIPPPGMTWFYLVRGTNGCGLPGYLGQDSFRNPRVGACP